MKNFDVIVIGAGPGGYVAAIRAAQLGLKVTIIEKQHMGGICLNWGCIPTKALLRSAEVYHLAQHSSQYGVKCEKVSFDLKFIIKRSRDVSKKLSRGIEHLMKKNKVDVISGSAKLLGNGKLEVNNEILSAKNIIIATGASARKLPNIQPDGEYILTYKEAMIPEKMPKSLMVIGSGAIGIEFASFYRMLGAEVTIVEIMPRILNAEDEEISKLAHKSFEKQGIKILTETQVLEAVTKNNTVEVKLISKDGKISTQTFDRVISAAGVVPNIENLGLEKTKVKFEKGFIKTGPFSMTDEPGVYAIGDVTAPPWLAHKASHEAVICVEKIANKNPHPLNKNNVPGCTYSHPQIASVGLTEEQAKATGHKIKVGKFPFIGNGKAIALGDSDGLVKTIFDEKTGELLGAHMIGAEVTELISSFIIGKTLECTELDFMHTIFPHPTLSEMIHESVLDAYSKAIHI